MLIGILRLLHCGFSFITLIYCYILGLVTTVLATLNRWLIILHVLISISAVLK